jgi:hypothetical protein
MTRLSALRTSHLYPPFILEAVDPRATVRPEGLGKWKIPMTPPGIKPAFSAVSHPTAPLNWIFKEIEENNIFRFLCELFEKNVSYPQMESKRYCFSICQKVYGYGRLLYRLHIHEFQQTAMSWHSLEVWNSYGLSRLKLSTLLPAGQPSVAAVNAQQTVSLLLSQPERLSSIRRVQRPVLFWNVKQKDDSLPFSAGSRVHRNLSLTAVRLHFMVC